MDVLKKIFFIWIVVFSVNAVSMEDEEPENTSQPTTPLGQTAVLGFSDDMLYRGSVNLTFNLNGDATSSNANIEVTNVRDVRLNFNGKFYTSLNPNSLQGVDIFVNGIKRFNLNSIQYVISSVDGFNLPFRRYAFMLNRNWLINGDNTILMKRSKPTDAFHISITKIRMEYNDPIQIKEGQTITKLYGHRIGTKRHLTGLRVEFASPSSDINFSVTGYDIDSATEVAVFLNQQRIGYLKQGNSNAFNQGDTFNLRQQDFVSSGINTIEFIQASSSSSERWGVTNLELGNQQSNLSGVLMLLLDD